MIANQLTIKSAALFVGLTAGSAATAVAQTGIAQAYGSAGSTAPSGANVVSVGYSSSCTTDNGACATDGNGSSGGTPSHGYRCSCPECSDPSAWERFCLKMGLKKREALHDHSTWAINHYRHLHHPKCPPYCHPSWGYYQTCWSRFPEESLWCPECPSGVESGCPLPAPASMPFGPAITPPPPPAHATPVPAPAAAPMPESPAIEQPPYEEPETNGTAPDMTSVRPSQRVRTVENAVAVGPFAEESFESPVVEEPAFLTPVRIESASDSTSVPHPSNRWRME